MFAGAGFPVTASGEMTDGLVDTLAVSGTPAEIKIGSPTIREQGIDELLISHVIVADEASELEALSRSWRINNPHRPTGHHSECWRRARTLVISAHFCRGRSRIGDDGMVGVERPTDPIIQRPDGTAEVLEGKAGQVGAGDAGSFDQDHAGGDRFERGAEVALAFQTDQIKAGWLDVD